MDGFMMEKYGKILLKWDDLGVIPIFGNTQMPIGG